ncbi:hypothetical protein GWK47_046826 [Chionoecetes opilio]|uniref:Uncharacterized protein n=1 Tax=Chionoecetes opilio TaxID=41210 RepID=A0A8J4YDK2_CHIOP|nr:hypothetical protein GWK47_046826 [Chionoecetes opilio]
MMAKPRGIVVGRREPSREVSLLDTPRPPLDPVLEHPLVVCRRCTGASTGGALNGTSRPGSSADAAGATSPPSGPGCSETSRCDRYIQEPVRFTVARAFEALPPAQCQRRQELCGVCSGEHASRACIRLLRARVAVSGPWLVAPTAVPGINAWNRRCPARLRQILDPRHRQLQWNKAPCSTSVLHPSPPSHG